MTVTDEAVEAALQAYGREMNRIRPGQGSTSHEQCVRAALTAALPLCERGGVPEGWQAIIDKWCISDHIRLRAGEMTAQEMRSVKAVVRAIKAELLSASPSPASAPAGGAEATHAELVEALGDLISDAERQMANPSHHMPFALPKAKAALAKAETLPPPPTDGG